MKNLGNTSVNWLHAVGIKNSEDLRAVGPIRVYNRIRERGFRTSRVLLYALEAALLDIHWSELSAEHKQRLVTEADELHDNLTENS